MASTAAPSWGFSIPKPGASLLLSFSFRHQSSPPPFLIIGSGPLAAQRAFSALEADASVVVIGKGGLENACDEIKWRVSNGQIGWVDLDGQKITSDSVLYPDSEDALALEKYISTIPSPKFLCITDTLLSSVARRSRASATLIYSLCHSRNINVNTTDYPDLCDFSFATTYRFSESLASSSSNQSSRIKREIVTRLPKDVGTAVRNVGKMRLLAKERDMQWGAELPSSWNGVVAIPGLEDVDPCADTDSPSTPNLPVPQRPSRTNSSNLEIKGEESESVAERTRRRMKWVAQISEYWPLEKLAGMTEEEMKRYLEDETEIIPPTTTEGSSSSQSVPPVPSTSIHSLLPPAPSSSKPGQILLIGSGPGHPSLLTLAAHRALTQLADIVLADKLVPAAVLALIPSRVEVVIARKFPGNADRAQTEMMERAVKEARRGRCVVRLKQGDPAIYGRFGEEVLYFRNPPPLSPSDTNTSYPPLPPTLVIPGVSSALAAPTLFDMPCTQRGAATSFLITTPVGKGGKTLEMPKYERARTVVVLMGVARLGECPIIERASMPDQRVIESTLADIERAMESVEVGAQRPPAMMVIGWSVLALWGEGNVDVLDGGSEDDGEGGKKSSLDETKVSQRDWERQTEEEVITDGKNQEEDDIERVRKWLGADVRWRVREGLAPSWDLFNII
ncbi:tetrapyrrole methylase [Gymnopus androsaceus JB14]|uniref:Tetrapyrrole methylase n=1 Tax=Gymnopus androsaceus JB14 TaxID=1447944 RepID=A0A6A4I5G4_9AGAR|nr:tetrapyrrole methylase [Gymnopus androsaceus JB14]